MPAPGEQYRPQASAPNPFVEPPLRISEFSAQQVAVLQSRLDKQLGPEYISTRPGAGGQKVHYLAADKVINLANQVFGFNGWSSQIMSTQVDFCDENTGSGKIDVGLAIVMRVTLRDGAYHEDVGYGHIENCKGKAAAFEKARKEAATDALKRSLRNFGNVLGNCLYDKDYLGKVTKLKAQPAHKWDAEHLHRHHLYVPGGKQEPAPPAQGEQAQQPQQPQHQPQKPPPPQQQTPARQQPKPTTLPPPAEPHHSPSFSNEDEFGGDLFDEIELTESHSDGVSLAPPRPQPSKSTPPNVPPSKTDAPAEEPTDNPHKGKSFPAQFFSANAVPNTLQPPDALLPSDIAAMPFNPSAQSPSLRRTAGVNHSRSGAVRKEVVGGAGAPAPSPAPRALPSAVNAARQIGVPMSPRRPGQGQFKAPSAVGVKRAADGRPALADVTNAGGNAAGAVGARGASPEKHAASDEGAKRAKMGEA